ncbi:MAG TPA: gamma-glutamyltransferase, partial [Blastocatellia bacterium]|nr:gamma-glutamyltransferase [Blastocatellia bacterium]
MSRSVLAPLSVAIVLATLVSLPITPATAETFRPVVRGRRGVVAAGHPLSAEAGLRLLQQGGNAIDAGCAAVLA